MADDGRASVGRLTKVFRLLANELTSLVQRGAAEALRDRSAHGCAAALAAGGDRPLILILDELGRKPGQAASARGSGSVRADRP